MEKPTFKQLCQMKYKDQAIWFMNGFWGAGVDANNAEKFWQYTQKFIELDKMGSDPKGPDGCELDQFWSAKFLEEMDVAISALARKEALRTIDVNNNGKMSPIEYYLWKFKKGVDETVNAPQGGGTPEDAKKLKEAQDELKNLQTLLTELQAAKAEQKRQEDELAAKKRALREKIDNPATSSMQRSKASNELSQLNSEDPLPLAKAKITTDAAVRRVSKQLDVTQKLIEELKRRGSVPAGAMWMMERELFDTDAYMPKSKMKYDHSKPFFFNPL
mmetsp:Transcript_41208/g.103886  ORF Transcript_41208/g.103886 Transcript_41208/m.103886 type:complete len:274 (-) Transcript_41208:173-994(-)